MESDGGKAGRPTCPHEFEKEDLCLGVVTRLMEECKQDGDYSKILSLITSAFSSPATLKRAFIDNPSQLLEQGAGQNNTEVTVNMSDVRRAYNAIWSACRLGGKPFENSVLKSFTSSFKILSEVIIDEYSPQHFYDNDPNYLNPIIIAMELTVLLAEHGSPFERSFCDLFHIGRVIIRLPLQGQAKLAKVWSSYGAVHLGHLLEKLQEMLSYTLRVNMRSSVRFVVVGMITVVYYASLYGGVRESEETLNAEYAANQALKKLWEDMTIANGLLLPEGLHCPPTKPFPLSELLGVDPLNIKVPMICSERFVNREMSILVQKHACRNICQHTNRDNLHNLPIVFLAHFMVLKEIKYYLMHHDNLNQMSVERHSLDCAHFHLKICRSNLVAETLDILETVSMKSPRILHKPLQVTFQGEPGVDQGGLSKEFFQVIISKVFHTSMGMFLLDDQGKNLWLNPHSKVPNKQFTMVGIILGLAIYNNIKVDVHLPTVLYRKLAGKLGCLSDLPSIHPEIYKSLQSLLAYEGDTTDLMTYFTVSQRNSTSGEIETIELIDGGSEILVTDSNKEDFANLYSDFLLNKQVGREFAAFSLGFHMMVNSTLVPFLFSPAEMEQIVCGEEKWDFHALQDAAKYQSGYTKESSTIKQFWEIAQEMNMDQKRKLLKFTTGSDRVPMGGLTNIEFVIARNGPDSDWLPTAHTCFNTLLLPQYSCKEKLKSLLIKAVSYCEGFGLF